MKVMGRIETRFKELKEKGEKALIAYIMAGDPSLSATSRLVLDLEEAGADIVELGVPFSDPVADGPTIQRAAGRAIGKGANLRKIISLVQKLRKKTSIPIILMTYYNPVLHYGEQQFINDAVSAGVDGIIIPDLIPDEGEYLIHLCRGNGLDTVFLLAPTSTPERVEIVSRSCTGFLYYVSITGITGAKLMLARGIKKRIKEISKISGMPVAVGFGVSTPEEAADIAAVSDGVIVGSAIVKRIEEGKDIRPFVASLKKPLKKNIKKPLKNALRGKEKNR